MTVDNGVRILMDVDTGVDDAMALAMAVARPDVDLVGVTTVAGNVNRDQATTNTLRVLESLGATNVPVYAGMARPLVRAHVDATDFHGHDGLGGAPLPDPSTNVQDVTGPEFIVQTFRDAPEDITLVCVGPLTNLAVALALEPELPRLAKRTVIMGGAFDVPGNTTAFAEFNIAVDPEAARIVAESELNATWIGLDVTHQTILYRQDWEQLADAEGPAARLVRDVSHRNFADERRELIHLHDPLALGVALDPSLVECDQTAVWVDTSFQDTAGTTRMVIDSRASHHSVALAVDTARFKELFDDCLRMPSAR